MRIQYAISLWNFRHYAQVGTLEETLSQIREMGYAVELWSQFPGMPGNLYDEAARDSLKLALGGMAVSLHSGIVHSFAKQQVQVDAARDLGASILVVHPDEFFANGEVGHLDIALCRDVVAYAAEQGVRIALENGQLAFLEQALAKVDGLRICLDIGHIYKTSDSLAAYLAKLEDRLVHLHLQDLLPPADQELPHAGVDHYVPGTGCIPEQDWELLVARLQKIDFEGTAVFEIRPRNPYQNAHTASRFFTELLPAGVLA
jgi:sugar phosphate isomerase/epimerase